MVAPLSHCWLTVQVSSASLCPTGSASSSAPPTLQAARTTTAARTPLRQRQSVCICMPATLRPRISTHPSWRTAAGPGAGLGHAREKRRSGRVSRVLSPPLSGWAVNIHLGPWLPRGLISEQPERMGRAIPVPRTARTRSYWLLLQVGFAVPSESPRTRCALTAPFHPYPPLAERAVCFLWHFPASHLDWPLASTLPSGARTFLPPPMTAVTGVHPGRSGTLRLQQPGGGGPLRGRPAVSRRPPRRRRPAPGGGRARGCFG